MFVNLTSQSPLRRGCVRNVVWAVYDVFLAPMLSQSPLRRGCVRNAKPVDQAPPVNPMSQSPLRRGCVRSVTEVDGQKALSYTMSQSPLRRGCVRNQNLEGGQKYYFWVIVAIPSEAGMRSQLRRRLDYYGPIN